MISRTNTYLKLLEGKTFTGCLYMCKYEHVHDKTYVFHVSLFVCLSVGMWLCAYVCVHALRMSMQNATSLLYVCVYVCLCEHEYVCPCVYVGAYYVCKLKDGIITVCLCVCMCASLCLALRICVSIRSACRTA